MIQYGYSNYLFPGVGVVSLAEEEWRAASVFSVHLAVLRAELEKLRAQLPPDAVALIERPDVHDPLANHRRMRILYGYRAELLGEVPPDTRWYEVHFLRHEHLADLEVISRCGWDSPNDHNELHKVALGAPRPLHTPPSLWEHPVLWGHERTGPFTILEGNNRLVAYVSCGGKELNVPALVGLSPSLCFWHRDDSPPTVLLNDYWKGGRTVAL